MTRVGVSVNVMCVYASNVGLRWCLYDRLIDGRSNVQRVRGKFEGDAGLLDSGLSSPLKAVQPILIDAQGRYPLISWKRDPVDW